MQTPEEMYYRKMSGETLIHIGRDNGVTRQRICQIIEAYEEEIGVEHAVDIARKKRQEKIEQALKRQQQKQELEQEYRLQLDKDIIQLEEKGFTYAEIASILGVDIGRVNRTLIEYRGPIRTRHENVNEETSALMERLHQAGFDQEEISGLTGYQQPTISQKLRNIKGKRAG